MKHSVMFKNSENHWDNGLPLGNGCFGTMVYFEKNELYMPMNHYEVYYNIEKNVIPKQRALAMAEAENPGKDHEERIKLALENVPPEGEPFSLYRGPRKNTYNRDSYTSNLYSSYPQTGDLKFNFCDDMKKNPEWKLMLYVEDAKSQFELKADGGNINIDTIVAREDVIINHVCQNMSGILKSFEVSFPPVRKNYASIPVEAPEYKFNLVDKKTIAYTASYVVGNFEDPDDPGKLTFSGIIRLCGAEARINETENGAEIVLENSEKEFYILTGVFTQWRYSDTLKDGISAMDKYEKEIPLLYAKHKKYWDEFFARSSITLPDKFLEHTYYVNQYALDCCSGKDGIMRHHACGLSGLWTVRHPNLWGSMWYWDVNIQAAFAGVFSSNRLDLAKVFSDGLLSYVDVAKIHAKNVHNAGGIAGDYPYSFYYSCWPWCAQYLWYLYEYSLDKEYLEKDAFPVFVGLCEFFCDIFKFDEDRGYYSVFPDVSPEQGPLTHDSIITVACVKYLFKFTLEAGKILGKELPIFDKCREIMNNMAPYPITEKDGMYGVHLKDSYDAPDEMFIRHPSMLMPLFPIAEFDINSDKKMVEILSNTIDFLEDRAEIGIFGGSWIAACAARLGRGQTALRLLYERGIDHMLRSNGLTAEKTDRFINFCLVSRQPLYYPCMMEFTGEMLAALNEMLVQSHNGVIRVFPAIPDGDPEYERSLRHGYSFNEYFDRFNKYDAWNDVRFDKLLCKGAFEVTASLKNRKIEFIKIYSKKGGKACVTSPFADDSYSVYSEGRTIDFECKDGLFLFDTTEGKSYVIAKSANVSIECETHEYSEDILNHLTYTKRNIYIGETPEVKYQKAFDGFIRDWYIGNVRAQNHTVYKFDFTNDDSKKYTTVMERQAYTAAELMSAAMGFFKVGDSEMQFDPERGFGFKDASKLRIKDSLTPDTLRRDFVTGTEDAEFEIEVPRGQYELFVASGDSNEESVTILEAVNGMRGGGEVIKKGEYQCKVLPLINNYDEPIVLKVSTKPNYKWKINFIMLNSVKGYQ